jgi:hypothetical protein
LHGDENEYNHEYNIMGNPNNPEHKDDFGFLHTWSPSIFINYARSDSKDGQVFSAAT